MLPGLLNMATMATVFYSDGSMVTLRYRLPKIARYLKASRAIGEFKEMKTMPLFPWLIGMTFSDAEESAGDREITRIEISEKVL